MFQPFEIAFQRGIVKNTEIFQTKVITNTVKVGIPDGTNSPNRCNNKVQNGQKMTKNSYFGPKNTPNGLKFNTNMYFDGIQ